MFTDLKATLLAWAESAPPKLPDPVLLPTTEADKKPWVQLPGANWLLSQCASALGDVLRVQPVYVRGGVVMWLNFDGKALEVVQPKSFASWVERFVTMWKWEGKSKSPFSLTNEDAGRLLASREFMSKLKVIERINPVRLPVLRAASTIELLPIGYDEESKTLTQGGCDYPLDTNFQDAWDLIAGLVQEFPFAREPADDSGEILSSDRNMAVAISAMVGTFAKGLLPQDSLSPAFLYVANTEGAGKTLLASLALVPVYGQIAVMAPPKDEEKLKQELLALVMSGAAYVVFDNWRGQVASSSLEGFITSTHYKGRIMRENVTFEGRKEVDVFITGNNCTMNGDMRRRSLMCDLFVEEARSEDRKIAKRMDIPSIQAKRGAILGALWSLVKHWDADGRKDCTKEHGSFAAWARVIGGIVERCGFGCPIGESRSTRSGDLYLQQMTQLCEAVMSLNGEDITEQPGVAPGVRTPLRKGLSFKEVVEVAIEHGLFEDKLELDKDGELDRKCKTAFAGTLKRYDSRVFKGTIRMTATGAGHGRKYIFERIGAS